MTGTAPERVTVLGAGTMGAGIALAFALAGSTVWAKARSEQSLRRAGKHIAAALRDLDALGVLRENTDRVLSRITLTTDAQAGLAEADLIMETIREDLGEKRALLRQTAAAVRPGAIIASNTSSLDLEKVFQGVAAPERAAGLHWFNPPELVNLVEVVRSPSTGDDTVERLTSWMAGLGKSAVVVNRAVPGFIANRLQYALLREAYALVADGVCSPADVDLAVTAGLGARWAALGPFQTMDLAGLDVHRAVAQSLFPRLSTETEAPAVLTELTARDALGCKTGEGLLGSYTPERLQELTRLRAALLVAVARLHSDPAPDRHHIGWRTG